MRKILSVLLMILANFAFATDYYVGGAGASDTNPGTASQPFATIQKAATVAVAGDVVRIRPGTYRETVTPVNSGSAGNLITFQADGGEVYISGVDDVGDTEWDAYPLLTNVYKKAVSMQTGGYLTTISNNSTLLANQVFKDGVMSIEARWPNVATLEDHFNRANWRPKSSTSTFSQTALSDAGMQDIDWSDGSIIAMGWYTTDQGDVSGSAPNVTLNNMNEPDDVYRRYYYLTGKLEALDAPNEWFYDGTYLYYRQSNGAPPTGISVKRRNYGFDLANRNFIQIKDINFFGCEMAHGTTQTNNCIIDGVDGSTAYYTSHGVEVTDHNYGIDQFQGTTLLGSNNTIKNMHIKYSGGTAIWGGSYALIDNNFFEYISYCGNYGAAVRPALNADNLTITHNTIYHTGRSGIDLGHQGNDTHTNMVIAYNDIQYYGHLSSDLGGIYGGQGVRIDGTSIHHNWIGHNVTPLGEEGVSSGYYADQGVGGTGTIVHHNVFYDNKICDFFHQRAVGVGVTGFYNNVLMTADRSLVTYDPKSPPHDIVRNNIFTGDIVYCWGDCIGDNLNYIAPGINPQFLQSGAGGLFYRITTSSPAKDAGVVLPGITDGYVGSLPDIGAYEFNGGNDWIAGHNHVSGPVSPIPPATPPLIQLKFNEASGVAPTNAGSLSSTFTRSATTPASSINVPATAGGAFSFDYGTTAGNYYVESSAVLNGLKSLTSFTLTGWLNCKSNTVGDGGNRLISWVNNGGEGVDLVYRSDGSLQLGVDSWPNSSPAFSSAGKVTTNAAAPAGNWVFFAVTYSSVSGQAQFYFGNNATDAAVDVTRTYNTQGAVGTNIGKLAIGAFNDATRSAATYDRMFRGLIDDVQIHGSVLTPANIVAVQRAITDITPPTTPGTLASPSKTTNSISLTWTASTDNVAVTSYEIYNGGAFLTSIPPATSYTLTGLTVATAYSLTIKAKDAANNLSTASNTVNVTTDGTPTALVQLKFNVGAGVAPVNTGTASSTFSRSATTPASSANVPTTVGGSNSFDFGTTTGNYYVESAAAINELKGLTDFTITGWLNSKASTAGGGGNRIVSWINNGGEGVDLVYQTDGSLRLGVDSWPDGSPAISSVGKVTTNAAAPATNWVFFAVTYSSGSGQAQFYFGNNATDATLDVTRTYNTQGAVGTNIGKLAIGAFNDATRNATTYDRMFRGLIDDVHIFGAPLSLTNIVAVQRSGDLSPPTAPASLASPSKTSTSVSLTWTASTDNVGVTGYEIYNSGSLLTSISPATSYNLTGLLPGTAYVLTIKAKDAANNLSVASNALNVTTNSVASALIKLRLNEVTGVAPVNTGTASSTFTRSATTPASSANVPTTVGGANAFDFGTTTGNYYVESAAAINELKSLSTFTISGWLNCRSTTTGGGGNRVLSWINNGGDGVDLTYASDGSLKLSVDQWPDTSPAFSSTNKVTANAAVPASNWVFFAVTYSSSTGQVQFYFGSNTTDATLDVTRTYNTQGAVGTNIGKLAIGAFNDASRNPGGVDRMFRGLIDEIRIHGAVLSLQDLVYIQRAASGGGSARIAVTPEPEIPQAVAEGEVALFQNYPNPYTGDTNIEMYLPHATKAAHVIINDVTGRTMKNIEVLQRGRTGIFVQGNELNAGMYFYSLMVDGKIVDTKRMARTK